MTNSIRRMCCGEPAIPRRSPEVARDAVVVESGFGAHGVVGDGTMERFGEISGETCDRGDGRRSQSLHSTASGREPIELRAGCHGQAGIAKPRRGKGGRKVDAERTAGARSMTSMNETAPVPARATQADSMPAQWSWVVRTVWTERMLAALGNGVKGDKRFSRCWPYVFFAALGRFTMIGVPLFASQSRCGNH